MRKRSLVIGTLILCGANLQGCLVECGYEKELHMIMIIPVIAFVAWLFLGAGNFSFGGMIGFSSPSFKSSKGVEKRPKGESRPRLSGGDKYEGSRGDSW